MLAVPAMAPPNPFFAGALWFGPKEGRLGSAFGILWDTSWGPSWLSQLELGRGGAARKRVTSSSSWPRSPAAMQCASAMQRAVSSVKMQLVCAQVDKHKSSRRAMAAATRKGRSRLSRHTNQIATRISRNKRQTNGNPLRDALLLMFALINAHKANKPGLN